MPGWVAGIGAGASIIGDLFSSGGQRAANAQSLANQMQAEQWQTQMSNTAMQRRVADLNKAGLNPMLAISQGGASTPGISPAAAQNPNASFGNLGSQVSNAAQAAAQVAQTKSNVNLQTSQADQAASAARAARASAAVDEAKAPLTAASIQAQIKQAEASTESLNQQAQSLAKGRDLTDQQIRQLVMDNTFRSEFDRLTNVALSLGNQRLKLGMPELQADSNFWSGPGAAAAAEAKAVHQGMGAVGGMVAGTGKAIADNMDQARDWTSDKIERVINWLGMYMHGQGHFTP